MISVIVPVYNVEDYLEECLESIRQQTYTDIEVILVNDGSTDDSKEICE
ncbi:glycosyltransferase family 2 protein, partial [Streptococcus mitis]